MIGLRLKLNINDFQLYMQDKETYSQLGQDLLVPWLLNEKNNGYFVEFGATNGIKLSNTYLLETKYGWDGILCEPSKTYHDELFKNRQVNIDTDCVYLDTGSKIKFLDTEMDGLATILLYAKDDMHAKDRQSGEVYYVTTVSLDDLLDRYNAPQVIDYMSIDTEGSELYILAKYSFSRQINVITVEHNYNKNRNLIHELLSKSGFTRIFESLSDFDDWYINNNLILENK